MLALGLVLCSLLCSIMDNSKLARNLHGMFHDVQTMVKKHVLSSLSFFPRKDLLEPHLKEQGGLEMLGEVGWFGWLV